MKELRIVPGILTLANTIVCMKITVNRWHRPYTLNRLSNNGDKYILLLLTSQGWGVTFECKTKPN